MMATETYEITLPKRVVKPLARRAKSDRATLSDIILRIIQEHEEMVEDLYLSRVADEMDATSDGKYLTHEEAWGLARDSPFDEDAFGRAVEEGTILWRDVQDPVAWVRDIRGVPHG